MSEERPLRGCDVCCGVDNHPRHVQSVPPDTPGAVPDDSAVDQMIAAGAPAAAVRDQLDQNTLTRHMDCCAARGCAVCTDTVVASGGLTGKRLLAHITGKG